MTHSIFSMASLLNAEVKYFHGTCYHKEDYIALYMYSEPTEEQKGWCEKYGFSIRKTIEHKQGLSDRLKSCTVWEIQHKDEEDIEPATSYNILHAMGANHHCMPAVAWESSLNCLFVCFEHKNDVITRELVMQMCRALDFADDGFDKIVEKYNNYIKEENK